MTDEEIVGLLWARSERAVTALSEKYGTLCRSVAMGILNNACDAEECVNDAYLGVWNSVPPHRPQPLCAYLCRVVRNLSLKRYHADTAKKRNSRYDVALDELEACLASSGAVGDAPDVQETTAAIHAFLGTLERENRVLFVRRYWFAESVADIARQTGLSENVVSVRLSRTRARLRAYLIEKGVIV